jgi:hypothetical protein
MPSHPKGRSLLQMMLPVMALMAAVASAALGASLSGEGGFLSYEGMEAMHLRGRKLSDQGRGQLKTGPRKGPPCVCSSVSISVDGWMGGRMRDGQALVCGMGGAAPAINRLVCKTRWPCASCQ